MKPNAIYSKSGKGVQEASGKTSLLKRGDRAVLSAIDGRATLAEVAQKVGKVFDGPFQQLIAQLDRDGFVREVTGGTASSTVATVKSAPSKTPTAPKPAKAAPSQDLGLDLDFTTIMPVMKRGGAGAAAAPATPQGQAKAQETSLYKAREEAEARQQTERERLRQETEAKARAEAEAKIRTETEKKLREEASAKIRAEAEAKAKAKAEAEARAKIEAERKAREEAERRAKEEAEKARREAEELRQRLEAERKAREEEERKRREEEERRRREEEERRAREEAERKAREDEERRRREEEESRRREEEERRLRAEIESKAREAAEQARREEEERLLREKEVRAAQARSMEEARARASQRQKQEAESRARKGSEETGRHDAVPLPRIETAAPAGGASLDALMADLDSFSQREDEERQARETADLRQREERKRQAEEDAERRARERAAQEERERRQQAEEEARRRAEEERRAQEEAEQRLREAEEQRRREAEERALRASEAQAAKQAAAKLVDDIPVSEDDLGMDDVRRDEAAVARETRKVQRGREREARERAREARERAEAAARDLAKLPKVRRRVNWGRPVAITLFVALVLGIGALHVVPIPMAEYEQAASQALGQRVRVGSARLSLYTGVRLNLSDVSVGDARIASVHAYPTFGSLIDQKKGFRRIELDGVVLPQRSLADTFGARVRVEGFEVSRILAKNVKLQGPVPLPEVEADTVIGPDGRISRVILSGPDGLAGRLAPAANGDIEFEVTAAVITIPFVRELTLSSFAMKGIANRQGMVIPSWGGAALDGVINGTARVRWSGPWQVDGVVTARNINAAVFAPALLSEGKAEASGRFSMSGVDPAKLHAGARLEGTFTLGKGALGTVDLSRVLQTSGRQHGGRTPFTELSGQGVYDRGAVALRNVNMSAGALYAAASADIAPSGALAGRIVADIRTNVQPLRATIVLGGTVKEPQVRN